MKSKFMRMVGSGVEEPEEEEQVFQEEEQEQEEPKILSHISDAEIDGFFDRFITTGFQSPYIDDKRMYVYDMNSKLEEFLKKSDLTNKIMTGGNKKKKRLVGGVTAFDNILFEMNNPLFNEFLINDGSKDLTKYNDKDIQDVIEKILNKIDLLNTEEGETEFKEKNPNFDLGSYKQLLRNKVDALQSAQETDVSPQKDILEPTQYERAINEKPYNITEEQYKNKYGMTKQSVKKMYEIKSEIGIDNDITSGKILKNLELFKEATQIDKFVNELNDFVIEARGTVLGDAYLTKLKNAGIKIKDELVDVMKNYEKGINKTYKKRSDFFYTKNKEEFWRPEYDEPSKRTDPTFFTNFEFDENKWDKYLKEKKYDFTMSNKIERIREENKERIGNLNYFKLIIKDLFVKTLHNPLIGNYYFNEKGELTKSSKEITDIISNRTTFVNDSKLKDYDYTDDKEIGNIYEYFEALVYSRQIATYIKLDIKAETKDDSLANEAYRKVTEWFDNNLKSLSITYGFFTGDIDRIDNIIKFKHPKTNEEYTINIETKASGRVSTTTLSSVVGLEKDIKKYLNKDYDDKMVSYLDKLTKYNEQFKKEDVFLTYTKEEIEKNETELKEIQNLIENFKSYDLVYTGTKKLLLLLQEYFKGNKKKVFCYNTLYYRRSSDIIHSIRNDNKFNITPDSASMLNIGEFVRIFNLDEDTIMSWSSEKKRGRPKDVEVVDEDNIEEKVSDNKEFFLYLKKQFEKQGLSRGSIYQVSNYENIYLGIPVLTYAGVMYDLKKPVNQISLEEKDNYELAYIGGFFTDKEPGIPKKVKGQNFIQITPKVAKQLGFYGVTEGIDDTTHTEGYTLEPPQTPAPAPPQTEPPLSQGTREADLFTTPEIKLMTRLYNAFKGDKKDTRYKELFKGDKYFQSTIQPALKHATPGEKTAITKANNKLNANSDLNKDLSPSPNFKNKK